MALLSRTQRVLLAIFLIGGAWFGMMGPILPQPLGVDAPANQFSAGRAFVHIQAIAKEPHPSGSAANAAVREYISARLEQLGLTVSTQTFTFRWKDRDVPGVNLMTRIPGTQKEAPAVALACHYDSVPTGPGASDDGAGVATLLETARALKSAATLKNDVVFFFTDGEEAGLRGAKAMAESTGWLRNIEVVFNFEARGVSGPVNMFETSAGNQRLVREFAQAVPYPTATSLMYEVYRRMPNDTDLTVFKKAGLAGLNFGFINEPEHYHASTDDPWHLSKATLQQEGANALSLTRHFGNINLPTLRTEHDAVYFDLYGRALVWYPGGVALLLAIIAVIRYAILAAKAGGTNVFFGAWVLPQLVVAVGVVCSLGLPRRTSGELRFYTAVVFTVAACIWMQLSAVRTKPRRKERHWFRRMKVEDLILGSMFWWVVLAIATAIWLPGVSYLFLWPSVFVLIAFGARPWRVSSWAAFGILCVTALPALFLVVPLVRAFYVALGPTVLFVPMILLTLVMGVLSLHVAAVSSQLLEKS